MSKSHIYKGDDISFEEQPSGFFIYHNNTKSPAEIVQIASLDDCKAVIESLQRLVNILENTDDEGDINASI